MRTKDLCSSGKEGLTGFRKDAIVLRIFLSLVYIVLDSSFFAGRGTAKYGAGEENSCGTQWKNKGNAVEEFVRGLPRALSLLLRLVGLGSPKTIRHTLQRLSDDNVVVRCMRGVYYRPEIVAPSWTEPFPQSLPQWRFCVSRRSPARFSACTARWPATVRGFHPMSR